MNARRRGLGRGLDALLGSAPEAPVPVPVAGEPQYRHLPVDLVRPGRYQPRHAIEPESLRELADSIRAQGVVQPIVVRPRPGGEGFEIVAGERRWRAAQMAGLHEVPALVREVSDEVAVSVALIENIQRQELNPLEEAQALHRLVHEFGMTHQRVADAVGRSRAAVSNLLRLLDLDEEVKALVDRGELEMGHARALLALAGEPQRQAARAIARGALSVREAERLVRRLQQDPAPAPARPDADVARLESDLAERLGARVSVRHGRRGSGTLTIRYNSLEELDGILAHIK